MSLDEQKFEQIVATLNGSNTTSASVGNYTERGFKSIYYGTLDITNSASVTYQVSGGGTANFSYQADLENYMNSLSAGTYTIKYNIRYLNQEITKARTVTLS